MRRIVYASVAPVDVPLVDLLALLEQARQRNAADAISGLLIYRDRFFLQLVEGPEAAVEALLGRLRRDRRHAFLTLLSDRQHVTNRLFPDWRMGFQHFRAIEALAPAGLVGHDEAADEILAETVRQDPGGSIMHEFLQTHRRALHAGARRVATG